MWEVHFMKDIHKTYSLVLGVVLGIVGVWGLFSQSILGIFGVNMLQSVLHLIAGGFGIYAGTKGTGHDFTRGIGWIAIALAVLGFIPYTATLLMSLLNINMATTVLHLAIGAVSLGLSYGVKK